MTARETAAHDVTAPDAAPSHGAGTGAAADTRIPRRLYAPLIIGTILNPINSSIVAVALVPIAAAFGVPASQSAWLVTGLYLATSVGQPLAGRLVDALGAKPVFLVGAALTMLAGVIGAVAPAFGWLIAARVVLGLGTCAGYPSSMSIARSRTTDPTAKGARTLLTVLAVATQTVAVIGPTLGGALIGVGGWPAVFAINVPLGLLSLVLGALFLPSATRTASAAPATSAAPDAHNSGETRPGGAFASSEHGSPELRRAGRATRRAPGAPDADASGGSATPAAPRRRIRLDLPGLALFILALLPLLVVIMEPTAGLTWMLIVAVLAGAGFVLRELRTTEPFIDLRMIGGNRALLSTYVRATLTALVSYTFLYGFTQWLEHARGLSPAAAGLILLPTFAIAIVVSALTGRVARLRPKLSVAAAAQLISCVIMLFASAQSPLWMLVAAAVVMGVSQGLANVTNQQALIAVAPAAQMGSAAGIMRTFFYFGAILSGAATALFFGAAADTDGLHRVAIVSIAASSLLLVLTLVDRSLRPRVAAPVPAPATAPSPSDA
ncbi:MFS transporter [Schumannella soli]|uniref:MFS transporter n=1 Tax=Schumannella soli TaxID=2590779 RepID=A0A506Y033_9MICO|nr:MFS transporter [Schumannella soli]TPW74837.1 MFS transporter [Schumannella soli]